MVGMQYHFGRSGRNVDSITNRGCSSGGPCGGFKKAGIFGGSVSWPQGNMGRAAFRRAPQRIPSKLYNQINTTRNPFQRRRARAVIF